MKKTESVSCPYCNTSKATNWATENGFTAVKCDQCGFIFVNPRPFSEIIQHSVKTGIHAELESNKSAISRRVPNKIALYKKLFRSMFADVWHSQKPISWLDIGAGYGEIIEAVTLLAPSGSQIEGVEPMAPKANAAKARGLAVHEGYVSDLSKCYDIVSLVHVFSHIPDFRSFLKEVKSVLKSNGEIFVETGNAADLKSCHEVPTELDLPDHLNFAGKQHIIGFLQEADFEIVMFNELRRDDIPNFCKNIIKKLIGRNIHLRLPYTSGHRAIRIRARLKT